VASTLTRVDRLQHLRGFHPLSLINFSWPAAKASPLLSPQPPIPNHSVLEPRPLIVNPRRPNVQMLENWADSHGWLAKVKIKQRKRKRTKHDREKNATFEWCLQHDKHHQLTRFWIRSGGAVLGKAFHYHTVLQRKEFKHWRNSSKVRFSFINYKIWYVVIYK